MSPKKKYTTPADPSSAYQKFFEAFEKLLLEVQIAILDEVGAAERKDREISGEKLASIITEG